MEDLNNLKQTEEISLNDAKETFASNEKYIDQRSLVLKEYLKKYIILGIDNDINGETLLTHSGYLRDNDVMIIQWIKHMYSNNVDIQYLLAIENAICLIVNFADKEMMEFQINSKDVTPKDMEVIIKKSLKYAKKELGQDKQLVDYSNMKWFIKLKNKILGYFYKK